MAYRQPSPTKRGYRRVCLYLRPADAVAFRVDAAAHGGEATYLRYLWQQDRVRRGLSPAGDD